MNYGSKNPGSRKEDQKRAKDREFLQKVKDATIEELMALFENHKHSSAPVWKKLAICRALFRYPRSS